jgi:hypothetical protein
MFFELASSAATLIAEKLKAKKSNRNNRVIIGMCHPQARSNNKSEEIGVQKESFVLANPLII